MKVGDKVINKIGIELYDAYSLTGMIIGIHSAFCQSGNRLYRVKSYDIDWGTFKNWMIAKDLKVLASLTK